MRKCKVNWTRSPDKTPLWCSGYLVATMAQSIMQCNWPWWPLLNMVQLKVAFFVTYDLSMLLFSVSPPTWSPQIAALPQAWLEVSFLLNKSSSFIWLPKAACMLVYIIKTEISDAFKGWLAPAPCVQIQPFLPLLYVLCMFSCMFSLCLCGFSLGILAYTQSSGYG